MIPNELNITLATAAEKNPELKASIDMSRRLAPSGIMRSFWKV